jgi:hypothetical protein
MIWGGNEWLIGDGNSTAQDANRIFDTIEGKAIFICGDLVAAS